MERIITKAGNTAVGPTGLSYSILKLILSEGWHNLFDIMHKLWRCREYVPHFWKIKLLHGIPKALVGSISGAGDLRPIKLMGVIRKIWTLLVTGQIKKVIYHRQLLQPGLCGALPVTWASCK